MAVRYKKIRSLAEQLLQQYDVLGASVPIEEMVHKHGVRIHRSPADSSLSGYLARDPSSGVAVIGVNSNQHPLRQRFTIAHEWGHLLLHKGIEVHVDHAGSMPMTLLVNLRDQQASEGTDEEEREANCFAAEILMPAAFIEKDVRQIQGLDLLDGDDSDKIRVLAEKYEVSAQAFGYRLANLHL